MQARDAEQLVERWLRHRGFAPERFTLKRRKLSKTPDFRVAVPGDSGFFVEVKTLTNAAPGHGAVAFKLVRAAAQFAAVNQGGRFANVVALVATTPAAVSRTVADLGRLETGPLAAVDLVLAFARDGRATQVLHAPPTSRHAALTSRIAAAAGTADPLEEPA